MPRVFIADKLEVSGGELLRRAGLEVDQRPGLKGGELADAVRAADAMIVRSATKVTAELLDGASLKAVARAGVGVDNIDVDAATRRGVVVMNTPGGNTVSAAEHTVALLMSLARHIPQADASTRAGKWERGKFMGTQLAGKTLAVVGLGRIGQEVARRARGLDMAVLGYDPFLAPDRAGDLGVEAVESVADMLPNCDFLTVHVPLSDATRGLIGEAELRKMRPTARLLNVARGGIIDEAALAKALADGVVAGAALDVYEREPLPADSPLTGAPNLILTPHLGASTVEAQDAVAREAAQLLIDYLLKGVITYSINMPPVDRAEMEELKHYVALSHRLGLLLSQNIDGSVQKAELNYRGGLAKRKYRMLTAAFTAGLLERSLQEAVNVVNAPTLANERGIQVVESSDPRGGDFSNLMQASVASAGGHTAAASGTLFGNQYQRLVQLDGFRLESFLDGALLLFRHRDAPGLIGHIGQVMGRHGVNIASMSLGRELRVPGGDAIAVLNLDSDPPAASLSEVKEHADVKWVRAVKLPPAGKMPTWLG